ncbi:hypothetical protein D3C72_2576850 [compost metagenome]
MGEWGFEQVFGQVVPHLVLRRVPEKNLVVHHPFLAAAAIGPHDHLQPVILRIHPRQQQQAS